MAWSPWWRRAVGTTAASVARATAALLIITALVAAAVEFLPGDAAQARAGPYASAADIEDLRVSLGLDRAAGWRWLDWVGSVLQGDLGVSALSGRPVAEMVAQRLPTTAVIAGMSLLVSVPLIGLATAVGIRSGSRGGGDALLTAAVATPQVVVAGAAAALLSGVLDWVPAVSLLRPGTPVLAQPQLLVLPVLSLALPASAYGTVLLRGAAADVVNLPHVRDARLRGLPARTIATRYLGPALAGPALQILAVIGGALLAGTALVESVFGVAGLGELLVTAVFTRDVLVVQAVAAIAAIAVLAGLAIADVVARLTDAPPGGRAPVAVVAR